MLRIYNIIKYYTMHVCMFCSRCAVRHLYTLPLYLDTHRIHIDMQLDHDQSI